MSAEAVCESFFKIQYKEKAYSMEEMSSYLKKISQDDLQSCIVEYRGVPKCYAEWEKSVEEFSKELELLIITVPHDHDDIDEYTKICAHFSFVFCEHMVFARKYLIGAYRKWIEDRRVPWHQGYHMQFLLRCADFKSSLLWISSAYDQLLQMVFWGDRIYEHVPKYKSTKTLNEQIIELTKACKRFYIEENTKGKKHCRASDCYKTYNCVFEWVNSLKHNEGVYIEGSYWQNNMYRCTILEGMTAYVSGEKEYSLNPKNKTDLDKGIDLVKALYDEMMSIYKELYDDFGLEKCFKL